MAREIVGDVGIRVDLVVNPASIVAVQKQIQTIFAKSQVGNQIFVPKNFKAGADLLVKEAQKTQSQIQKIDFTPAVDTKKVQQSSRALKSASQNVAGIGDNIARAQASIGAAVQQFTGLSLRSVAVLAGLGLAADPIVLVFRGLAAAITSSITAARDLNEAINASRVTFGSAAPAVEAFARAASSIGLSTTQALDATRGFGSLFKSMGLTADQAAFLSIVTTQLTSDVASLSNVQGGAAEVAERFRSGILGNIESLERLNINLRISDVQNSLLRRGIVNTRSEIDTNTQSLETLRLIFEKTTDSQGDFANTAEEVANRERVLRAQIENLKGEVGDGLIPVYRVLLDEFRIYLTVLESGVSGTKDFAAAIREVLTGDLEEAGKRFRSFLQNVGESTGSLIQRIGFEELGAKVIDAFTPDEAEAKQRIEKIKKVIDDTFKDVKLSPAASQAIDEFVRKLEKGETSVEDAKASIDDLITTVQRLNVETARANKAIEEQADNIRTLINAQIAYDQSLIDAERAVLNVEKAERARAATQRELDRLGRQIEERELAVRQARFSQIDAIRQLNNAERDRLKLQIAQRDAERAIVRAEFGQVDAARELQRAQEDLIVAQQELVEVQQQLSDNIPILQATLNYEQAQLRLKEAALATNEALIAQLDAQLGLFDAQLDLEQAQRRGRAGARDQFRATVALQRANLQLADAQLEPERARLGLLSATLGLREAELELQRVQSGVEARRQLQAADRALEDAQVRVRDATIGIADAEDRLISARIQGQEAQEAVLHFDEEIEKRRINVKLATLSVHSAEDALEDARERRRDLEIELIERELAIRSALLEVKSATAQVVFAYDDLNVATAKMAGNTIAPEQRIEAMRKKFGELAQMLGDHVNPLLNAFNEGLGNVPGSPDQLILAPNATLNIDQIDTAALASSGNAVSGGQTTGGSSGMGFPFFQHGGFIGTHGGIVGEGGRELFIPSVPGVILPNGLTEALLALARGAGAVSPSLTANISTPVLPDPRSLAFYLARELARIWGRQAKR